MFHTESIQDGGKQICSESRLAETGVDRKEFREKSLKRFLLQLRLNFIVEAAFVIAIKRLA